MQCVGRYVVDKHSLYTDLDDSVDDLDWLFMGSGASPNDGRIMGIYI